MQKAYRIETSHLTIRSFKPGDAQLLIDAIEVSKEHLSSWMPWAKHEPTDFETKVALLRQFRGEFDMGIDYKFGIFNNAGTELIGSTGLHTRVGDNAREIGYWVNIKYTKKGFALEAAAALTKLAFEVEKLDRIEIHCAPENIPSQKIPQKLGFHLDGILRNRTTDGNGIPKNRMIWTIFRDEYEASPAKQAEIKAFDILDREIILI